MEALVRSGAFDCFGRPRAQLFEALDRAIDSAKSTQHDRAVGQASLFGTPELALAINPREAYDEGLREWPELERLKLEKEAIGFYVTGHPLDRYKDDLRRLGNATITNLERKGNRAEVVLCAVVTTIRERPLKDGSGRMAFVVIEDLTGAVEMAVSAKTFAQCETVLKCDAPLIIKAAISIERDEESQTLKLRCLDVKLLSDARRDRTHAVEISLEESQIEKTKLGELKQLFTQYPGTCPVRMTVRIPHTAEVELDLPGSIRIEASDALVDRVEAIFGTGVIRFA
jgi:DNA polymerase-3 subunit alpha